MSNTLMEQEKILRGKQKTALSPLRNRFFSIWDRFRGFRLVALLWVTTHAWCDHAADVDLLKTLGHFEQVGIGLAFMDV